MKCSVFLFILHSWLFLLKLRAQPNCFIQFRFIILFGKYAKYNQKQFRVLATIWNRLLLYPRTKNCVQNTARKIVNQPAGANELIFSKREEKTITSNSTIIARSALCSLVVEEIQWKTIRFVDKPTIFI